MSESENGLSAVLLQFPEAGVAVVRINRPEARNALNLAVREQLAGHFRALADDEAVRCAIVTGGEQFAAGADVKWLKDASPADIAKRRLEDYWAPIKEFPKPLIAAVRGYALGAGCELAMHADIIVAGDSAQFGQPEIRLGIMPGAGGTQRLPRAVGKFKAMKMLLTGELVAAAEAEAMGLVSEVVADAEVEARALKLARTIARQAPLAARKIKEAVRAGAALDLDAALALERQAFQLLFDSDDQKEGMAAFLEKRHPRFRGA